jgi:hypothetical protein
MVAPMVLDGPNNREAFLAYVDQVLAPELRPGDVVIMDNLSSHKEADVHALGQACSIRVEVRTVRREEAMGRARRVDQLQAHLRKPPSASTASGTPSAVSSTCIRPPRAPATSPIAATMQTDRKPLYRH